MRRNPCRTEGLQPPCAGHMGRGSRIFISGGGGVDRAPENLGGGWGKGSIDRTINTLL